MAAKEKLRIALVGCGGRGLGARLPAILLMSDVFELTAISPDGSRIVCDTTCPDIGLQLIDPETGEHKTLCYPRSSNGGTQWAETVPADDDKVQADTYGPQWSHPHPSFSPDGQRVIYTSDQTGSSQIYVVEVPD